MSYSAPLPSPACPDAAVLARYHEQKLGPDLSRQMAEHVRGCASCQRRLARLDLLAQASRAASGGDPDDDEATVTTASPNPTSSHTKLEDPRGRPTDHDLPVVNDKRSRELSQLSRSREAPPPAEDRRSRELSKPKGPVPPTPAEDRRSRELSALSRAREKSKEPADRVEKEPEKEKAEKEPAPGKEATGKERPTTGTQYLEKGSRVGRYMIRDVMGVGGMGAVYSAYDPELNRKVALKVLRTRKRSGTPHLSEGRSRLMREAQAMARLSHPNIVTVFDVGHFEGEIYIAMELVDGTTLTEWLTEKKRTWKDVALVFLYAGRGLAAAHAAGLVHRDFKPDNVLVGKDGRVRVMDFGLARPAGGADEDEEGGDDESSLPGAKEHSLLNSPLTRKGILVGTPVYMAPEQFLNEPIDARADQFAFSVALYEALYGHLPFTGDNVEELAHAIVAAKLPALPPRRAIPLVVHRVLRRGMRSEPRDRYTSMDSLLRSLEWGIHFRPRAAIAAGAAVVGLTAFLALPRVFQNAEKICPDPSGELAGVWDEQRQKAVETAFVATRAAFAKDTFRSVQLALNDFAQGWAQAKREACLATRVRREQSEDVLDLKYGCLDRRRHELGELVGLLLNTDAELLQRSVNAASSLSPVRGCDDLSALAAPASGPEQAELRAKVSGLRDKLAAASARYHAGKHKEALPIVSEVCATAAQIKFRPLEAEALALRGRLEEEIADYKAAEQTLLDAAAAAGAARLYSLSAESLVDVTYVVGNRQGRTAEANHLGQLAAGMIEGLGNPDDLTAHLFEKLGVVSWAAGDYQTASKYARRSVEIREKLHGSKDAFEVARALNQLGVASRSLGQLDEALGAYGRTLSIYERVLGKDHPDVAATLNNLGNTLTSLGRYPEADASFSRALKIQETAFGTESPVLGPTLNNLALALQEERKYDAALQHLRRAVAITEKAKGLGPEHPRIPPMLNNIANSLLAMGKTEEALATFTKALAIREKTQGPNHANLANELTGIGETYLSMGKPHQALAPLERALKLREQTNAYPERLAKTRFALARALWGAGENRERALTLAMAARDSYADPSSADQREYHAVNVWIIKHPLR